MLLRSEGVWLGDVVLILMVMIESAEFGGEMGLRIYPRFRSMNLMRNDDWLP